ncbi:hypothetical protein QUF63_17445 [Anaerolineales bacterium HSG25]|nr:hypothetical protein [Anaerolineales bacterium HSG25]
MTALLDSGFLYATADKSDRHHKTVIGLFATLSDDLLLPTTVLVEISYLLQARLRHDKMRLFLQQITNSSIQVEPITKGDLPPY